MIQHNDAKITYSPDKLLIGFAQTRFLRFLLVSIVAHAAILLLLSLSYIRDQIDPKGAERRKTETLALKEAAEEKAETAAPAQPVTAAEGPAQETEPAVENSRTNALIVKQISELPKPGEIPDAPDDLGISIHDTNLD